VTGGVEGFGSHEGKQLGAMVDKVSKHAQSDRNDDLNEHVLQNASIPLEDKLLKLHKEVPPLATFTVV